MSGQLQRIGTVRDLRATINDKWAPAIREMCGKKVDPEQFTRLFLASATKTPKILECTPTSIYTALLDAANVGLMVNTPQQEAFILPYRNPRAGVTEAQFQVGYKGFVRLALEAPRVKGVGGMAVYENDEFSMEPTNPEKPITHKIATRNRGAMIGAYAFIRFDDGTMDARFLSMDDIEQVRRQSKSADSPTWKQWIDQMGIKAAFKRLCKFHSLGGRIEKAVEADNKHGFYDISSDEISVEPDPIEQATVGEEIKALEEAPDRMELEAALLELMESDDVPGESVIDWMRGTKRLQPKDKPAHATHSSIPTSVIKAAVDNWEHIKVNDAALKAKG